MKASQRFLGGKEAMPNLFDEAQMCVFKELLPYWAGFRKTRQLPSNPTKRPVTKYEKMLKKRLEKIENYQIPSKDFVLPRIPDGAIPSYTITLSDGATYREQAVSDSGAPSPTPEGKEHRGSRIASSLENLSRKSRRMSTSKEQVVAR